MPYDWMPRREIAFWQDANLLHSLKNISQFCKSIFTTEQQSNGSLFPCTFCEKSFSSKKEMKLHRKMVHVKPHKCKMCGKSFNRKSKLEIHVSSVHEGNMPFQCNDCDFTCAEKYKLITHLKTVHKVKEY